MENKEEPAKLVGIVPAGGEKVMVDPPEGGFEVKSAAKRTKVPKEKACKRLSRGTTREALQVAHKSKMVMKSARRQHFHQQLNARMGKIFANLSKNHKNFGKHPKEAYT